MHQPRATVALLAFAVAIVSLAGCGGPSAQLRPYGDFAPEAQLQQARDSFLQGDRASAARHLDRAATLTRVEAGQAFGRWQISLQEAARDLDDYAGFVRAGLITSVDQLDQVLRRTDGVLAQYHDVVAVHRWLRNAWRAAVHEVNAIVGFVQRAGR